MVCAKTYTLCGGTFFVLLLQAINDKRIKEPALFKALLAVVSPDFDEYPDDSSMKVFTTQFKTCENVRSNWIPIKIPQYITKFDGEIKNSYAEPLQRMRGFREQFIPDETAEKWLINAICETIYRDPSIEDTALFYVYEGQKPVTKKVLLASHHPDLSSFLLGVWHYIVTNRPDNSVGRVTFEGWHEQAAPRYPWKFKSSIGKKWKSPVLPIQPANQLSGNPLLDDDGNDPLALREGMTPIVPLDGIVPEITENPPLVWIPNNQLDSRYKYGQYLKNARNDCNRVRTILYSGEPRNLDDFYVCNTLFYFSKEPDAIRAIPMEVTAKCLQERSTFISLSAPGGTGKSMMLRHLLLDAVDNGFEKIPIFISLKDYRPNNGGLIKFFFERFNQLGGANTVDEFEDLLSQGECLLLLDGLDEMKPSDRLDFENALGNFTNKYKDNMFILSSRPVYSIKYLEKFEPFMLWPFDKKQAIEAMEKLEFQPQNVKEDFICELKHGLFEKYLTFAENPLLLNIMLLTYARKHNLPSEIHHFYWEAYLTLFQNHDATKHLHRPLNTHLTVYQFADYLGKFCAESYYAQQYSFDDFEFQKYFGSPFVDADNKITALDFKEDLISLNLMVRDADKCSFIHRSMQEFFCAWYASRQDGEYLRSHISSFEAVSMEEFEYTFLTMLHAMTPSEKIEKYVFEPVLSSLFKSCDAKGGGDSAYLSFLFKEYPWLYCLSAKIRKDKEKDFQKNRSESRIYGFIVHKNNIFHKIATLILENASAFKKFAIAKWSPFTKIYRKEDLLATNREVSPSANFPHVMEFYSFPTEYVIESPKTPFEEYKLDIDEILEDQDKYKEIIDALCSDGFSVKVEYLAARKYWQSLVEKYSCSEE